jgi:TRAP transporter TAXI family solute receptor
MLLRISWRCHLSTILKQSATVIGLSLILWLVNCSELPAAQPRHYILTTATTGGTYYPVGVALATLTKVKLEPSHNIALSAISSAGSGENIKMLRDKTAQFAILQGLYGAWAWNGSGKFQEEGAQTYLRSITMLWQNVEHFAIKSDYISKRDMSDLDALKDKWFSLGQRESGTEGSGLYILEQLGYSPYDDFQIAAIDYGSNSYAIQNGSIEAMNIPGGPPVSAVTQAYAALGKDISLLNFTDEQLKSVNRGYPLWHRFLIPVNTYPGQDQEIATIAQPNFLAVRSDVDDEVVYLIVKTIYRNLPLLHIIHSATKTMALEKAINELPVPLHPGAARFYREQGIDIPDHLIIK